MRNSMPDMLAALPNKPKLRPCFDVIFMEGKRCQIRAGDDVVIMFAGRIVSEVFPKLFENMTGRLTISELAGVCRSLVSLDDVVTILTKLDAEGVLEDGSAESSSLSNGELDYYASQITFFSHFGKHELKRQERLKNSKVAVIGLDAVGAAVLSSLARMGVGDLLALEASPRLKSLSGVSHADTDDGSDVNGLVSSLTKINPYVNVSLVKSNFDDEAELSSIMKKCDVVAVAADTVEFAIYEKVNKASLINDVPWLMCGPLNSIEGKVGPFFIPHETCCYRCYELRTKSNLKGYAEYMAFESYVREREERAAEFGYLNPFPVIMGGLAALEIIKHITGFASPETYGCLTTLDFLTFRTERNEVFKLPRCPDCSLAKDLPPRSLWSK
jgi:thiazole/oxazole-forming peptide maturase SagC family component